MYRLTGLLLVLVTCRCWGSGFQDLVTDVNSKLFEAVNKNQADDNVIISPLSISVALSMLYHGTADQSRDQLTQAFAFPAEAGQLKAEAEQFIDQFNNTRNNVTLRLGNAVFLNGDFAPKPNYIRTLERRYSAEVQTLERNKVDTVNDWISEKTEGLIEKFLSEGSLDQDTKMLLVNAIYFHGAWFYPFPKELTFNDKFYTDEGQGSYVNTDFLDLEETLELVDEPKRMKMVVLPYSNSNFSMMLFQPADGVSVNDLAEALFQPTVSLAALRDQARKTKVNLKMPKFEVSTRTSLVEAFESLNVTDIFDEELADLSRLADEQLHVGDILHAANVKVDEEGSEAAGITSISIDIRTSVSGPTTFILLDRPFLFSIVGEGDVPLFAGKIINPTDQRPIPVEELPAEAGSSMPDDVLLAVHNAPPPSAARTPADTVFLDEADKDDNKDTVKGDKANNDNSEMEDEDDQMGVSIKCPKGEAKVTLDEFNSCEKSCLDGPSYGLCIFGCWNRFCQ